MERAQCIDYDFTITVGFGFIWMNKIEFWVLLWGRHEKFLSTLYSIKWREAHLYAKRLARAGIHKSSWNPLKDSTAGTHIKVNVCGSHNHFQSSLQYHLSIHVHMSGSSMTELLFCYIHNTSKMPCTSLMKMITWNLRNFRSKYWNNTHVQSHP